MLSILKPIAINDTHFVSSSEPETDAAAFSLATTYARGDLVMFSHAVYESLQAANLNHSPGVSPTWWLKVRPTNRWACLDGAVNTATKGAGTVLTMVLQTTSEFVTAVGLVAAAGSSVQVTMVRAAVTVYDQTQALSGAATTSFWEWFYGDHESVGELVFADLPPLLGATITVIVTADATPAIGVLALGSLYDIGEVDYGVDVGIIDYSRKTTDTFGTTELVEGAYARRGNFRVSVEASDLRRVNQLMTRIRSTPCLFIGHEDTDTYGPLTIWGWPRQFSQIVSFPTLTYMNLQVEGLS